MFGLVRRSLQAQIQIGFSSSTSGSANRLFTGLILCSQFLCDKTSYKMAMLPHTKALTSPYTPESKQERQKLNPAEILWSAESASYNPPDFTDKHVLKGPVWADPDETKEGFKKIKFNMKDGKVNRTTYHECKTYEVVDGRPRNPVGRTGLKGRGLLGKWGPNHAADPIVTRWKRDNKGKTVQEKGKNVLQFVAIKRKDNGQWAIPGGMVDAGEKVSIALKREFGEEAMNSLEASDKDKKKIKKALDALFKTGQEVYRGYVDDPRNTDNAWMETIAVNFHDKDGDSVGKFKLKAGDDAGGVQWMDISATQQLYASHEHLIKQVAQTRGAHW